MPQGLAKPPSPAAEASAHEAQRARAFPACPAESKRLNSQALFAGKVEIEIEHFSQVYRLRQTSLGKLILTK